MIIATERSRRPQEFPGEAPPPAPRETFCPFCEGNETKTPPEVLAVRRNGGGPDTPGWSLRVVRNKFPALRHDGELDMNVDELFESMNGVGHHEVIIESPDHSATLAALPESDVARTLWAYRERILALQKDERIKHLEAENQRLSGRITELEAETARHREAFAKGAGTGGGS